MTTTRHSAYGSLTDVLTTELDGLANNTNSTNGPIVNNSANRLLHADMVVNLAAIGAGRSAGGTLAIFMLRALDGVTWDTISDTLAEPVAVIPLEASTAAQQASRANIPVPPGLFRFFARNNGTGQALAASGNAVRVRLHAIESA